VRFTRRWWSKGEHSLFKIFDLAIAARSTDHEPGDHHVFCVRSAGGCLVHAGHFETIDR
jgi:hypothetical protein